MNPFSIAGTFEYIGNQISAIVDAINHATANSLNDSNRTDMIDDAAVINDDNAVIIDDVNGDIYVNDGNDNNMATDLVSHTVTRSSKECELHTQYDMTYCDTDSTAVRAINNTSLAIPSLLNVTSVDVVSAKIGSCITRGGIKDSSNTCISDMMYNWYHDMNVQPDDEPYWEEPDETVRDTSISLSIETRMDFYCDQHDCKLVNVSGLNNNCLLEAVECALSAQNQTVLLLKSHNQIRKEMVSYIQRHADSTFHYPSQQGNTDMPITFRQHTTLLESNMTWREYINSIKNGGFLDLQCGIALSHMYKININIWKFDTQTNECLQYLCEPPGVCINPETPSITIALRDNVHFYAVLNVAQVPSAIRYMNCRMANRNTSYPENPNTIPNGSHISTVSTLEEIAKLAASCNHRRAAELFNKLLLGVINVRTLNGKHQADQFHFLYEYSLLFSKLGLDIVGLVESRIKGNDICWSDNSNYKYFFSGNDNKRIHGVGVAIKLDLYNSGAIKRIVPVNERIMVVCCSFGQMNISIVVAYAPVENKVDSNETKKFYQELHSLRTDETILPREFREYMVVMGDFNARVGTLFANPPDNISIYDILGEHITDKRHTANGVKMLEYCNKEELFIANSFFESKRSSGSNTCGLPIKGSTEDDIERFHYTSTIDYMLMSQNLREKVEWCQVHEGATPIGSSDHLLVAATIHISGERTNDTSVNVLPKFKGRHKFATDILRDDIEVRATVREALRARIAESLARRPPEWNNTDNDGNVAQSQANELFKIRHDTCVASLPTVYGRSHSNPSWYEANEQELNSMLKRKHDMYAQYIIGKVSPQEWKSYRNECTKNIRRVKEEYILSKAHDMVEMFEEGNIRGYYAEVKKTFGNNVTKYVRGVVDLLPGIKLKDGKTKVSNPAAILDRWREHFSELFNQESRVAPNIEDFLPLQQPEQQCDSPIMNSEISEALKKIEKAKAPGDDGISSDLELLCMTPEYCNSIAVLFNACLREGIVPDQLKHVIIIPLFKKGAQSICDNYRGISLINVLGKLYERILLERIETILANSGIATDIQYGFTYDRNTSDGILTCRVLQTICKEQNRPLYMGFIDLEKAYDRVHRPTLWRILRLLGIPIKIVTAIEQLNTGSMARVHAMGAYSTEFPLNNGVKQGSVLSPCLYNVFMGAMMTYTLKVCHREALGVEVLYQPNARLFDRQDINNIEEPVLKKIVAALFADDVVMFAPTPEQLQRMLDIFTETVNAFGQKISATKTEVMASTYGHLGDIAPEIQIKLKQMGIETLLKQVKVFKYLGSHLEEDGSMNHEIGIRCQRMWVAYHKYAETTFLNDHVPLWNKLLLYTTMVTPQATYGCGAWIYTDKQMHSLEFNQLRILNRFMKPKGIKWMDMQMAMKIASMHRWKSLVPIACRIHAMQIKFLAHLLKTVKVNEQLHIICRCKMPPIGVMRITQNSIGHVAPLHEDGSDTSYVIGLKWHEINELEWNKIHKSEKKTWERRWMYMKYYQQLNEQYGQEVEMDIPNVQLLWNQRLASTLITKKAQLMEFYRTMFNELNLNKECVERSCRATHRAWVRLDRINRDQSVDENTQRHTIMYADAISRTVKYFDLDVSLVNFRKQEIIKKALLQGTRIPVSNAVCVYPGWRKTLKDVFFNKQRLTKFVKEEGRNIFLLNWRSHEFKRGRQQRLVESDTTYGSDDDSGNHSHSELEIDNSDCDDDSAEDKIDSHEYIEVDITNVARALIGSKGTVIRHFKREYGVHALTIQQGDFTTLQVTGTDKTNMKLFVKAINEYNESPKVLYQALKHRRKHKLRIFIDISNIACGMQYTTRDQDSIIERDFSTYLNTGALMDVIRALRTVERVVVVGSSPSQDHPFWRQFGDCAETHVLPRQTSTDNTSVEIGVDDKLHELMLQDINTVNPHDRIMVLVSGDGNRNTRGNGTSFPEVITNAVEKGWLVEVWSWKRLLHGIYHQLAIDHVDKISLIMLDDFKDELAYSHKEQIGINSSHRKSVMNKRQRRRQNVCQNINNNTLNTEIAGCEMDSPYDNRIVVALVPGDTVQSICGDTAVGYYTNDPIVECLNEITATPLSRKRSHKLKYRQRRIENNKRRKEYDGDQ